MKYLLALLALAASPALAQVEIPLDQPVTVQQPVTQNVTLTAVQVSTILFDLKNERILFGSNGTTIVLDGPQYQAIKASFLDPFSAAVAPSLRLHLSRQ